MDYFIAILMMGIFFLGFVFIDNIYSIAATDTKVKEMNLTESKKVKALILGDIVFSSEIKKILEEEYDISSIIVPDTKDLNKSEKYEYVLAVSKLDLENLMLCSISANMMNVKNIIAICNNSYNKKIYEDNNFSYLYGNVSSYQLVSTFFSSMQKSGGDSDVHY